MKNKRNNGFTLIEVIIAVALSTIVIGAAYSWVNISNFSFYKTKEAVSVRNEIRNLNDLMSRDIQQAQNVTDENPYVFINNGNNISYYYDEENKAVVRDINGKKEFYIKGKVESFNLISENMKLFTAETNIWDKDIKDFQYTFNIARRFVENGYYDDNDDDDDDQPTDHGYYMTLAVGSSPAGGVVVTPNENINPLFYHNDYEDGFDMVVEDIGHQGRFRITVFGYEFTYNYNILESNRKVKAMFIENIVDFDEEIRVFNYSSYHVNIGYEDNKKVEISSDRLYKYSNGRWKKEGNI